MPANLDYVGHAITLDDMQVYDPSRLAADLTRIDRPIAKFWGKANNFVLPRGRNPGIGHLLMLHRDVVNLDGSFTNFSHVLRFDDDYDGGVTIHKLGISRVQALTGMNVKDVPEAMYLVEVTDARSIAPYSAVDKTYNVRTYQYLSTSDSSDYYYHSLNSGSAWTWTEIINDLWAYLPTAMASVTIGASWPTGFPENYSFRGMNAWDAINKILDDTGHTIYRNLLGVWTISPKGSSQNINRQEATFRQQGYVRDATWDHPNKDDSIQIPAKVSVYFHAAYHAFQSVTPDPNSRVVTGKDAWISMPLYKEEFTSTTLFPNLQAPIGTNAAIHDSLCAYYDEAGTLLNGAQLTSRAQSVAENYLTAKAYRDDPTLHSVYLGYHAQILPGPEVEAVWWFELGRGSRTEVLLSPLHYSPADEPMGLGQHAVNQTLAWESVAPPDVARHGEPTDRMLMCEVYGGDIAAEGVGEAKVLYGTHTGAGAITWTQTGKIIDLHNPWQVPLPEDSRVMAFWHLQTRRWIAAHPRRGVLYKGLLNADMCPGSNGVPQSLVLKDVDSCDDISVSVVFNPLNLAGRGNDKFIAYWDCNIDDGDGGYVVLQVEHHEEEYVIANFVDVPGCVAEVDEFGDPTGRTVPTYQCKIKYDKRKISVMWCRDAQLDLTLLSAEQNNFLVDWWLEGYDIKGRFLPAYVLCPCDTYDEVLAVGVSCETGSGSGSGSGSGV